MNTYIIDILFEKYTKYASSLSFFNQYEMERDETEESKLRYKKYLMDLADNNYFKLMSAGHVDDAKKIIEEIDKKYIEKNPYVEKIKKQTGLSYYEVRTLKNLSLLEILDQEHTLALNEEIMFKEIYNEELEYHYKSFNKPELEAEILFNKISLIFILFSTIINVIKKIQEFSINDNNINEYYLNNFLVSNGFLFYNNLTYDKKRLFTRHIIEYHNNKGSLNVIYDMLNVILGKDVSVFEYYLYYDEEFQRYYFLKVKPTEEFMSVLNTLKNERILRYEQIVSDDPSWTATEDELLERDIKFLKSKYFSIEFSYDMTESLKELSFLTNKVKRYRDLFHKVYDFKIDAFPTKIELLDFMLFLTLMAYKVNNFPIEDIVNIPANENLDRFAYLPKNNEGQLGDDENHTIQNIYINSIKEIENSNLLEEEIIQLKKHNKTDHNLKQFDKIKELKRYYSNSYLAVYRPCLRQIGNISIYTYLTNKYSFLEAYLTENDPAVLQDTFLDFINTLEKILLLYGQSTLKFKDIYSSLYLPKVMEIINFFKSLNAKLLTYNNTFSIDKTNRLDIFSDDYTTTGIVRLSNRDLNLNTNSGNDEYKPEKDFINKENIVDNELDLINKLLNTNKDEITEDSFGKDTITSKDDISSYKTSIVDEYPYPATYKEKLLFTSFNNYLPFIDNFSNIYDTDKRLDEILKSDDTLYLNGKVIDFYGQDGSFKKLKDKHKLSPSEFKKQVSSIAKKYSFIFGNILNNSSLKKEDYIYNNNARLPFLKKPYLLRRVNNKVSKEDLLLRKMYDNTFYTDAIHIYKHNKTTDKFDHVPEHTDKYRSLIKKNPPKYTQDDLLKYSGQRTFTKFIDRIKQERKEKEDEENFIGTIPVIGLDIIPE